MTGTGLLRSQPGEWLAIGGLDSRLPIIGADTDDAYFVGEYRLQPGRLIAPHRHGGEREVAYVVGGELRIRVGADEFAVPAGSS